MDLVIKVFDNCGVEEGGDGVEDSNIHAVCDQQENIAWVGTKVLDGAKVGLLLIVLFHFLSSVGRSSGSVLET